MKDITIKGRVLRREISVLIGCFIIAFVLNIIGIISYDTSWTEVFTSLHIVLLITGILYVLAGIFRILFWALKRLFKGKPATAST